MSTIQVVAALVTDPAGRVLMVRKRGTGVFMNPGGKPEPGESAVEALRRELVEELGLSVDADRLAPMGCFTAPAANEPGFDVTAEVFRLRGPDFDPVVGAEIEEARWVDVAAPGDAVLAPLFVDQLLSRLLD